MKIFFLSILLLNTLNAEYKQKVELPNIAFPIVIDEDFRVMQRNCQWCHSFGYITNQGKRSKKYWQKMVVKMRDVYKAPISQKDEATAVEYLFRHYGE